ncbi:TonB-dependent receptor plug domain-containing protein [Hymenobacter sp. 15J16-1T3B]|uniref:TonB-dependent receptor plug domain-containing protein n=1 Tax=Hymenobacter sp. 15J16-1T3B TaxID=2886941 RepID=UPI001D10504A|nr:TonB-dependent receptor plug domain-containing protein [Hymenobacter sp. 15J16-1T3B]MCC3156513.1 TonB-dependent receptor plug domain-containing protein [Hymenobacter sp. 15J16-1T3B]
MHRFILLSSCGLLVAPAVSAQQLPLPDSAATRPATNVITARGPAAEALLTAQPLLSQVAGVQVTPYSGAPGAAAAVYIRGASSVLLPAQPLYVVDGLPAFNLPPTAPGLYSLVGDTPGAAEFVSPPLLGIPVEDIASVEVVKGAAATAAYGSQGSNGVIRISTRRGQAGRPLRLRYAVAGGVQQVRQRYELLDAQQYATLLNAIVTHRSSSSSPPYSDQQVSQLGRGTDWQDELFRTGAVQRHFLSLDGGNDTTRYYFAADYQRQSGVVQHGGLTRYGLRARLQRQLTARLRADAGLSLSRNTQRLPAPEAVAAALLAPPTAAVRRPDGRYNQTQPVTTERFANPLQLAEWAYRRPTTLYLLGQLGLEYQVSPTLQLTARANYARQELRQQDYAAAPVGYVNALYNPPLYTESVRTLGLRNSVRNYNAEATARYERNWGRQHWLAAELRYLHQGWGRQQDAEILYAPGSVTEKLDWQHLNSATATLHYRLRGRYDLTASLRADRRRNGSPAQSEQQNPPRTYYPGAQLSWRLGEEPWLHGWAGLSQLTAWVGVGQTGTFGQLAERTYVVRGASLGPFDFQRLTQAEAGLRAGWLHDHLVAELTAYQRHSRHVANLATLVGSAGLYTTLFYDSQVHNRGLEATMAATWQLGPGLTGTTSLAAALNDNRVTRGPQPPAVQPGQPAAQGQPVAGFFGVRQDGVYPAGSSQAGAVRFANGGQSGYLGNALPRQLFSFTQQLHWHRFGLDAQLDAMRGHYVLNELLTRLDFTSSELNHRTRALDYWTPANPNTIIPAPGAPPVSLAGLSSFDYNVRKADCLRLTQLALSVELVRTDRRQLSFWAGGQNLWVLTAYPGFDPNVSSAGNTPYDAGRDNGASPLPRTWLLGLNASF